MSATNHLDGLCNALTEGRPVVLLLGQDAWASGTRPDPVLEMAFKRIGGGQTSLGFPALLNNAPLPEGFYDWLAEAYSHQPEAAWMEEISRLPLNAVFTSSINPAIAQTFRINGRDVEPILSNLDNPASPRSRRNLHLTYLFGRAGERNASEAPPSSIQELRRRTSLQATPLLSRVVETTTSLGILVIDGLNFHRDWLSADTIYGILSAFSPGQVYWFGWNSAELTSSQELLLELAAPQGPVVFVNERLSPSLRALALANKIDFSSPAEFTSEGCITIGGNVLEVEPATRLKVSTAASIVEDTWTAPLQSLGAEAAYIEFRRFHGHVEDARRLIDGIRRGFAIERTFEKNLYDRVLLALSNAGRRHKPVLIHGQSGSGKSLALARLASMIRKDAKYPVLLASRTTRMPAVEELDDFCRKAEEAGAEATLLICDANMPASRYSDLLRGFVSRGRRMVVVGSAYRIVSDGDEGPVADSHLLEVPAELDSSESDSLVQLVSSWTGAQLQTVASRYLLAAIYRILPEVRPRLAAGLANEARVAEDDLRVRGSSVSLVPPAPTGALSAALVSAGLVDPKTLLEQKLEVFLGSMSDAASRAVDLVMVPGKLDCPVPVNLLMRALGSSENLGDVATLFSGIDLFRWSSNDEDDIFVHPRLGVEAELITARRLGTAHAESEIALRLLENASPSEFGGCERRFVLDLVHRLGPDGPFGRRYASYYLDIARALTDMRTRRGVKDPRLMLQEATLRRRVLRDAPDTKEEDLASILEEARQVVDVALDEFGENTSPGLRRACANLKVERAAIYGYRAVQQLQSGAKLDDVWQFYKGARDSARSAVYAADSYFAIDVSVWVPSDLLRFGIWDTERRAELEADIWDGMERIDPSQLDPGEQERFEERRLKVAQALNNNLLAKDALTSLDQLGSKAGIFLQARAIGGALQGIGKASAEDLHRAECVNSFMNSHREKIKEDARCLRYFLKSSWLTATGSYFFGGERSSLPAQDEMTQEFLFLLETLGDLEGVLGDPRTQYLRAVLLWRLRREHSAREVWHSLSRETAFSDPRRVIRHHIWTESSGQPRLFHGRVTSNVIENGRARIQVEELRQEIELLQRDFPTLELRRGASIPGGFFIAFNFIGPVAEPPKRQGGSR